MLSPIDRNRLDPQFPTQYHDAALWEQLGRTVAAFGFLEDVLARAVLAFSGMQEYKGEDKKNAMGELAGILESALKDALGKLTDVYVSRVKMHSNAPPYIDDLVARIRSRTNDRNAICHGAWMPPDVEGKSRLLYFDRKRIEFKTKVDLVWLKECHLEVTSLIVEVINSVHFMGWQFPGGAGPGTCMEGIRKSDGSAAAVAPPQVGASLESAKGVECDSSSSTSALSHLS